ncbi:MAG: hypothetical protein CMF63_04990 [Magnetovibrio sp.]|nr:hypothetical protein [Magnetovibrio sp.]
MFEPSKVKVSSAAPTVRKADRRKMAVESQAAPSAPVKTKRISTSSSSDTLRVLPDPARVDWSTVSVCWKLSFLKTRIATWAVPAQRKSPGLRSMEPVSMVSTPLEMSISRM